MYDECRHHSDCRRPKEMNDKARLRLRPLSFILNPTVYVCMLLGTDTSGRDWVITNRVRRITSTFPSFHRVCVQENVREMEPGL
jgi:hypothetical protein